MLTRLRGLWRAARAVPVMRTVLLQADRLWWARTIRRARIVDAEHAGRQLGRPVSERQAVRAYVFGGFARGLSLNPLFAERVVSEQLPDADRVPALYAYLVTDPADIRTSLAWDAPAYAAAHPDRGGAGGPLGQAWRALRAGGSVTLRGGREADLAALHAAADPAVAVAAGHTRGAPASTVLRWELGRDDADGEGLRAPLAVLDAAPGAEVALVLDVRAAPLDVRLQARLLAAGDARIRLHGDEGSGSGADAAPPDGTLLVRRSPGAVIPEASLRALLSAPAPAAPLWLDQDGTIASAGVLLHDGHPYRALAGHPREDAQALGAALPVAALDAPVQTSVVGAPGTPVTLLDGTVTGPRPDGPPGSSGGGDPRLPPPEPRGLAQDGWRSGPDGLRPRYRCAPQTFRLPDGTDVPRLRWAIKTGAPAGQRGESWGETHFARSLAAALERLGQYVAVDARPALERASSALDDVVLSLRGPHPLPPAPAARTLLWIISHPDEITAAEVAGYDRVFAASPSWARSAALRFRTPVLPLLQCTDAHRFRPSGVPRGADLVFVGTARGIARPSVVEPLRAGRPVRVYGPDWRGYIPGSAIAGTHVRNEALPALYESAGAVLNDHWPAMRREGFVSNRLFDVVAAGGRAISDDVAGIAELFEGAVRTYADVPALLALTAPPLDPAFCSDAELAVLSARIRAEHSFDARARALLEDVRAHVGTASPRSDQ